MMFQASLLLRLWCLFVLSLFSCSSSLASTEEEEEEEAEILLSLVLLYLVSSDPCTRHNKTD